VDPDRRGAAWPGDDQWAELRRADQLEELHSGRMLESAADAIVDFDLPMPGISFVELIPQT
jgi:xylan 1,4-beta-xylosidase